MRRSVVTAIALVFLGGCASLSADHAGDRPAAAHQGARDRAFDVEPDAASAYREDAMAIEALINRVYAYLDRFEAGKAPLSDKLRKEAEQARDSRSLLRHAERTLLALDDHHAITGSSLSDSWAVVPSYADLWIIVDEGAYIVEAVRAASPAQAAGIKAGDRLTRVGDLSVEDAVIAFWDDLGLAVTDERAAFAARVLAAGRRDRPRHMSLERGGAERTYELPSLYSLPQEASSPVTVSQESGALNIRINDSLGEAATISAFDAAMALAHPGQPIVIDLTQTPSGGNTSVARAILGWFVDEARPYQVHALPVEKRDTGIARQWIEQVLPREGKHHDGPVRVLVGRWTGSMGEGLAIGFDAIGATITGTGMAGLLGAIYDYRLENSGLVLKLPAERLMHVNGVAREAFVPQTQPTGN